jgi:hypothetical protein
MSGARRRASMMMDCGMHRHLGDEKKASSAARMTKSRPPQRAATA